MWTRCPTFNRRFHFSGSADTEGAGVGRGGARPVPIPGHVFFAARRQDWVYIGRRYGQTETGELFELWIIRVRIVYVYEDASPILYRTRAVEERDAFHIQGAFTKIVSLYRFAWAACMLCIKLRIFSKRAISNVFRTRPRRRRQCGKIWSKNIFLP